MIYMGMTTLPQELEEALCGFSHGRLLKLLRAKTTISGTDTAYTAIQEIAKAYTLAELEKVVAARIGAGPEPLDEPPPPPKSAAAPLVHKPRIKAAPDPSAHPQHIIDEKTAAIKAAGGSICYDRTVRGWPLVSADGRKQVLSSAVFRSSTIQQLLELLG